MRLAFLGWLATAAALASLLCPGLAFAQSGERSGKEVVDAQCSKCHREGKGGAPKIGDRDAWIQRLKNGLDKTVASAIRGHGGMPPRGDKADLTDREVRNAILYMYYPGNAPK